MGSEMCIRDSTVPYLSCFTVEWLRLKLIRINGTVIKKFKISIEECKLVDCVEALKKTVAGKQ